MTLLSINERSRLTWTARSPRRSPRSAGAARRFAVRETDAASLRGEGGAGARARAFDPASVLGEEHREKLRARGRREAQRGAQEQEPDRVPAVRGEAGGAQDPRGAAGGGEPQSRREAEIRMVGYHVRREKVFFARANDSFYSIINMGVFVFVRDETHHALREDSSSLVACRGSAASRAERRANAARDGQKQKQKQKQKDARFASITTRWR